MTMGSAVRLAGNDNVGVVTSAVRPGLSLRIADGDLIAKDAIPFGHKIALSSIAKGERVMKFGVSIGRAKVTIEVGEHVHVHNIESDYINNAVDHFET